MLLNAIQDGPGHPSNTPLVAVDLVEIIRRVLNASDANLDYTEAKLAFDAAVDPASDHAWARRELDALTAKARILAGGDARPSVKIAAIRTLLHKLGPWNDDRPFAYDMSDPEGRSITGKLLHNYLRTRRGQCVSMPALFLILAERLGVEVTLVAAPEHVFVRHTDELGQSVNLETTSGGHPARDTWYREKFPVTELSIRSGLYLRTLTKREGIAVLASTVVEQLFAGGQCDEVIAACRIILQHHPRYAFALVAMGTAYGHLLARFRREHPDPRKLSPDERSRGDFLMQGNARCYAVAERLGWTPFH